MNGPVNDICLTTIRVWLFANVILSHEFSWKDVLIYCISEFMFTFFLFIEIAGVSLVNKITQVSVAHSTTHHPQSVSVHHRLSSLYPPPPSPAPPPGNLPTVAKSTFLRSVRANVFRSPREPFITNDNLNNRKMKSSLALGQAPGCPESRWRIHWVLGKILQPLLLHCAEQ